MRTICGITNKQAILKTIYITAFPLIAVIMLCSCASSNNAAQESSQPNTSVLSDSSFNDLICKNPIDKATDLDVEGIDPASTIEKYSKYCLLWEDEIAHTLDILKDQLSEQDYRLLMTAQNAWTQYISSDFLLNKELYYTNSAYNTGDSYTYPTVTIVKAKKIKNRAIELFAYAYSLTGTIEYAFDQGNS